MLLVVMITCLRTAIQQRTTRHPFALEGGGKIAYGYSRCRLAPPAMRRRALYVLFLGLYTGEFTGKEKVRPLRSGNGAWSSPPRASTLWWHRTTVPNCLFPAFPQTTAAAAPGPRRLLIWRGTLR